MLPMAHRQACDDAEPVSHRVRYEVGAVIVRIFGEAVLANLADWLAEIAIELLLSDHAIPSCERASLRKRPHGTLAIGRAQADFRGDSRSVRRQEVAITHVR